MCDFIVDIKESQCKKRFCFLRWLLPLLSPISCIPIMFSNYFLIWWQPLRFFFCRFFIGMCRGAVSAVGCRSPPFQSGLLHFKNFRLEGKNGIQQRTGEQKEAEEKILREWQTRRSRRRQWPLPKCLSQGYHYDGGKWTQAHFKWLKALELSGLDRETLRGVSDHIWIPDEPDREFW